MSASQRCPGVDPVDLVACLPVALFHDWWDEGGVPEWPEDLEYHWEVGRRPPTTIETGRSRLYIVCGGLLRGFAPIRRVEQVAERRWSLVRDGLSAEATTIPAPIPGFRGWRYRWWDRADEREFSDWAWESVPDRSSSRH
jgi:hypothetical protein